MIREKILASYSARSEASGIALGRHIKREIESEKIPLCFLITTKERKCITDRIIADAIRTVMRAYYDENKGGLFRAATRHAELALEICTNPHYTIAVERVRVALEELARVERSQHDLRSPIIRRDPRLPLLSEEEYAAAWAPVDALGQQTLAIRDHAESIIMDECGNEMKASIERGVVGRPFNPKGNYANLCRAIVSRCSFAPGWGFSEGFQEALGVRTPLFRIGPPSAPEDLHAIGVRISTTPFRPM